MSLNQQNRPALRLFPASGMMTEAMKMPINMEEKIGKTVGRRTELSDPFAYAMGLQRTASKLRELTVGRGLCPKGVFKFKTHEEADAWMMKMLVQQALKAI
jgi:hypothetical protein